MRMFARLRVGIALLLALALWHEGSAQQNTPPVAKPPADPGVRVTPPVSVPERNEPVATDPCLHIEEKSGALARLKKKALGSVKKNGGDREAFLRHLPDDPGAQCKYYMKVIEGYR